MKRIKIAVIFAIFITILFFLASVFMLVSYHFQYHYRVSDVSQLSRYAGDINADFKLTWEDVTAMQGLYLQHTGYTQEDLNCADLNHDGIISREDTAILLHYFSEHDTWTLAGLESYCKQFQKNQE